MGQTSEFDPNLLISHKFPEATYSYSERDVILYALGVGACARDAVDENEMKYVYHKDGEQFIQVLPTFAALFAVGLYNFQLPGLEYDPRLLLHGQQYIEIYKPFPSSGRIQNKAGISGFHDKGKAAIVEIEVRSYEKESGELLCTNRMTTYLRGAGGFSKSSEPYSYSKYPKHPASAVKVPKSQAFVIYEDCTQPSQALLCCIGYLVTTILCIQIQRLQKLQDSLVPYCMGCAHWGLQLGQSSNASAEETQTW